MKQNRMVVSYILARRVAPLARSLPLMRAMVRKTGNLLVRVRQ